MPFDPSLWCSNQLRSVHSGFVISKCCQMGVTFTYELIMAIRDSSIYGHVYDGLTFHPVLLSVITDQRLATPFTAGRIRKNVQTPCSPGGGCSSPSFTASCLRDAFNQVWFTQVIKTNPSQWVPASISGECRDGTALGNLPGEMHMRCLSLQDENCVSF